MDQQVLEVDERERQQEQRRQEQHRQTRKKGYLLAAVLGAIDVSESQTNTHRGNHTMPADANIVKDLMKQNLLGVFGERDAEKRRGTNGRRSRVRAAPSERVTGWRRWRRR